MINVGRQSHLSSTEAERQVQLWVRHQDRITDAAAVTIAAGFGSPNPLDMPFTTLSQSGKADPQELIEACQREMESGSYDRETVELLQALQAWAARF